MGRAVKAKELQKLPWVNRKPFWVFNGDEIAMAIKHKHEVVVLFMGTPENVDSCLEAARRSLKKTSRIKMPKKLREIMVGEAEAVLGMKYEGNP